MRLGCVLMIVSVSIASCAPSASWAPAVGTAPPTAAGSAMPGGNPTLYLDRIPNEPFHEIGHLVVSQGGLTSSLGALFASIRQAAAAKGCDGVLVKTEWIPEGMDDGRIGVFVSLYVHGELRVNGLRATCIVMDRVHP